MKSTLLVVLLTLLVTEVPAQWMIQMNEDSLLAVLKKEKDTTAVRVLLQLTGAYFFKQPATSLTYAQAAIDSSRKIQNETAIIESSVYGGEACRLVGAYVLGLRMQYEANQRSINARNKYWEANSAGGIGMNYFDQERFEQSATFLRRAVATHQGLAPDEHEPLYNIYLARYYVATRKYDSAHYLLKKAGRYLEMKRIPGRTVRWRMIYHITFGDFYNNHGKPDSAHYYYKAALKLSNNNKEVVPNHVSLNAIRLSLVYGKKNQLDSSLFFARSAFKVAKAGRYNPRIRDAGRQLADVFRMMGNADSALYYKDIAIAMHDSILGTDKMIELQLLQLEEQKRTLEIQQAEERYQNSILLIGSISIAAIILVASVLLFRSNRIKQKTNVVLRQTLNELKATQSQLVHSEKMASLGELTAGIAHEIQNPLNFVNNFAEVNRELIADMESAIENGNLKEAKELGRSIADNHEKINNHGKRADAIVKSMLQHSRSSTGQKEQTDINVLCDEYFRLAYHGFRAKDKTFRSKFETDFDPSISKVKVVAQELGRVILNLVNNAFYAVNEKAKKNIEGYEPCVKLVTKNHKDSLEIRVSDNGTGMSSFMREKIFQPFYTTKPTGQGTGLGLSLAYDIITKAHGGELKVETTEGAGSEFIILLPLSKNV